MGVKWQKNQLELAFMADSRGEAPRTAKEGTETPMVKRKTEHPALPVLLMEQVCQRDNLSKALQRVKQNEERPGQTEDGRHATGWASFAFSVERGT